MNNFNDFMVLAKLLISENFPNFYSVTSSYLESFRQVFDADALAWLSTESYLLFWVCLFWVTFGLVKTTNASSADIILINSTAKYTSLMVLIGAAILTCYRSLFLGDTVYLLNDMVILDNWVNWSQLGILVLSLHFLSFKFSLQSYS